MSKVAVIIPCFNEAERLQKESFLHFLSANKNFKFVFVNDGSTDDTYNILYEMQQNFPEYIKILSLAINSGKGEAVRKGIQSIVKDDNIQYIGYLDADLSTPLEEFVYIYEKGKVANADIIIGSRIKKADSLIKRSFTRHVIGRLIATIVDFKFKLGIYDTQCGAKIFKQSVLAHTINDVFRTKWFFDIEILLRIKKKNAQPVIAEIPLNSWHHVPGSKINISNYGSILKDVCFLVALKEK